MTEPKHYSEWLLLARRYDRCVDYGSPMSAWTPEMLRVLRECGGDKQKAQEKLCVKY